MANLADKAILSGADNRPPMLEKDMYDSWKSRMELYMLNRQHGRMILESVEQVPLLWPSVEVEGVTRLKKYSDLSAEAIQADCDVKATNIILQGLPPEVYVLVSTHKVAKELWERIQMLMQGTSLTKQERERKLYDAFDKFAYQKGETLQPYPHGESTLSCGLDMATKSKGESFGYQRPKRGFPFKYLKILLTALRFIFQSLQFCWSQTSHTKSSDEILKPFNRKGFSKQTGLHEMAMAAFESQYIDRDTYSTSAKDIEVQSCFFDDQLTSLSPPLVNPLDSRNLESSSYHALGACLRPYNAFLSR
nr:hypothetical protein [Tanacetum cinerariifolium]